MTQIHPKDTFLNGDVMISNKGQKSATIADSITGESFTLTPGKFRASHFPTGWGTSLVSNSTLE